MSQRGGECREFSGLLRGKRGLIMGVANQRSLAWGIAKACHAQGAELAFTYQGEALRKRVEPLAQEVGGLVVADCDVTVAASLDAAFVALKSHWETIDFVVHAIAFSDREQLDGRYVDTTADNFSQTLLVSCYSFTAIAQRAEKMMPNGGSMLTLTYYGVAEMDAALQRDGRGQGRAGSVRALPCSRSRHQGHSR